MQPLSRKAAQPRPGGVPVVTETDSLFSPEYEVSGSGARRVLKRLARPGLMLNMMSQGESDERLASVIDRIEGDASRLIVDQPPDLSRTLKEFESGQPVWLMWADAGMRFGAQARILQVHEQGRSISYRIVVEGASTGNSGAGPFVFPWGRMTMSRRHSPCPAVRRICPRASGTSA